MKAFLLAAGEGTRLKPITDRIPKCLVPINGKPLLHYWFKLCEKHEISEVLINLHHLPELVKEYLSTAKFEITVRLSYEERLLGSGGTIKANYDFIRAEDAFFIFYTDNLTNANLKKLLNYHVNRGGILTMGLFRTDTPEACGVAEIDETGLITNFEEKPKIPRTDLANAGIYVASPLIMEYFPSGDFIDLAYDVLPQLVGKIYGFIINEYIIDVGTLKNYARAQSEAKSLQL